MTYQVVLHRTEERITVSVPGLPGCWSEGETEEEALINIAEAISEHLSALQKSTRGKEVRQVEVVEKSSGTISHAAESESPARTDPRTNPGLVPRDDWERRLLAISTDCGTSPPPSAWTSEEMYD